MWQASQGFKRETTRYLDYSLQQQYMAKGLTTNIKAALKDLKLRSVARWTDSTVVLHSLSNQENFKVFVENRVKDILNYEFIQWKYPPKKENAAGIGIRGSPISKLDDI